MVAAILFHSSSSDRFWMTLICLLGGVAGTRLFFIGFRMLRYKRLILDTPLSRIHSASIGLVEVTGAALGPKTLTAPVTTDPCYYYRVRAWQLQQSGKNNEWKQVLDESQYVPFFLEDSTGRVLIDSQRADMDVHRSFFDEIGSSFRSSHDLFHENARSFLVKRGLVSYEKIKIEERIIQPGFPLFVFGTLGENPLRGSWDPRPHVTNRDVSSFNFRFDGGPGPGITLPNAKTGSPSGQLNAGLGNAVAHFPGTQVNSFSMQPTAGGRQSAVAGGVATKSVAPVAVLDREVPANAVDSSFDLHPNTAISKGERGEPFTISCRSQKEVVQSLAWKSTLCIWGGPILAIAFLYLFLLGWGLVSL